MGMLHNSEGAVDVFTQESVHKTEAWTSQELQEGWFALHPILRGCQEGMDACQLCLGVGTGCIQEQQLTPG